MMMTTKEVLWWLHIYGNTSQNLLLSDHCDLYSLYLFSFQLKKNLTCQSYIVKNGRNFYGDSVKVLRNIKRNLLRSTVKTALFYKGFGKNIIKWPRLRAKYSKRQFFFFFFFFFFFLRWTVNFTEKYLAVLLPTFSRKTKITGGKVGNRTARYFSVKFTVHRKKFVVYYILPVNEVILRYFYHILCKRKRFLRWTVKITLDIV